jgi:hypothetical protein
MPLVAAYCIAEIIVPAGECLKGKHAKPGELSRFFEFFITLCPTAGMPLPKRLLQFSVEHLGPHLQEQVITFWAPLHLLAF